MRRRSFHNQLGGKFGRQFPTWRVNVARFPQTEHDLDGGVLSTLRNK